jgi:hypothetical protein
MDFARAEHALLCGDLVELRRELAALCPNDPQIGLVEGVARYGHGDQAEPPE